MANPKPRQQGLTKDDNVDFDATWNVLETALQEIHTKNASKLSFEELYRNAYKIVLKKKGDVLYERVSLLEESWLRDTVGVKISQFVTSSIILGAAGETFAGQSTERRIAGERFMRELKDAFSDHQLCMGMITDVLMYMVRLCSSPLSKFSVKVDTLVAPGPCYTVLFTPVQGVLSATAGCHMIALRRLSQTTSVSTFLLKQPY
jgi:cullin 3